MNENITKTTAETENNTNETTQAAPPPTDAGCDP